MPGFFTKFQHMNKKEWTIFLHIYTSYTIHLLATLQKPFPTLLCKGGAWVSVVVKALRY